MRSLASLLLISTILSGCLGGGVAHLESADAVSDGVSAVLYDTVLRDELTVAAADGTPLRVSVWRPETDEPVPVILVQSPYWSFLGDAKAGDRPTWYIDYFVPRGYAVALGEMRGTRDSGGCWDFGGELDQRDGYDVVEGLAAMPWSNGNVGMLGQSHVGMSQVAAAVMDPPSLKAIVPIAAVTDWYRYLYFDGAPYVLNRGTPPAYLAVHASPSRPPTGGDAATVDWVLTQAQTACADNVVHVSQSAELDGDKDAYWQERDLIAKAGDTRAAVFLVHGFLDENVKTDHFLDYWQALPDDVPRKAWFGQWHHEHPAYLEWRQEVHRWYDHFLKGIQNGVLDGPRVTVQDNLGHNRTEEDWPPAGTVVQDWHLGAGLLAAPGNKTAAGRLGYHAVPGDDRAALPEPGTGDRPFVSFPSRPLARDLRISGAPTLDLTGALSAPEGRWIAVLYDVGPGVRDEVTRGYLDAGHADGLEQGTLVTPFLDAGYTLRMFPRDHAVQAGHHLELVLFGGDMGCQAGIVVEGPYADTCEGTGILPVEEPVFHHVTVGDGAAVLHLPVATADGPERALTELQDWLDDLPE